MDLTPLPLFATLQEYNEQADALLHAHAAGDTDAMELFRCNHPDLRELSLAEIKAARLTIIRHTDHPHTGRRRRSDRPRHPSMAFRPNQALSLQKRRDNQHTQH